jgi:exodeoxyribonuclease-3
MRSFLIISCILLIIDGCTVPFTRGAVAHLPASEGQHAAKISETLRVLSYNVLTGFQKNPQQADRFVEWVKNLDPDVIGLQELSTFTQDSLERLAHRYGHSYAVLLKGKNAPIGITSKYPVTNVEKMTETMHHGCIHAEVKGFHFFITHLSPFSYAKCLEEIKEITDSAAKIPIGKGILIMGDLNSFSPEDSVHYSPARKYGVVQMLLDKGYTDCYKKINQSFGSSFPTTAYASKVKTKQPVRIDYMFVNNILAEKLLTATIIRDSATSQLSDHYPLLVEFKE